MSLCTLLAKVKIRFACHAKCVEIVHAAVVRKHGAHLSSALNSAHIEHLLSYSNAHMHCNNGILYLLLPFALSTKILLVIPVSAKRFGTRQVVYM